jgi:hypothetical protein
VTTEPRELAARSADNPALAGLRETIVSVIETTRRHWEITSDRNAAGAIADPAGPDRPGEIGSGVVNPMRA